MHKEHHVLEKCGQFCLQIKHKKVRYNDLDMDAYLTLLYNSVFCYLAYAVKNTVDCEADSHVAITLWILCDFFLLNCLPKMKRVSLEYDYRSQSNKL